ncbi:HlyD family secretion protein [Comamonas badia]|mgnify:CR=1 FL=1|uniref:HlyD family secretion protein n=1 Tax=Comamonas badia TaxID=265291 RepID=UPI0004192B44|nr:efflux RND transporter periplasmic adaptor subunit [Comamonas badia]
MSQSTLPPASRRILRGVAAFLVFCAFLAFIAWGLKQALQPVPQQIQGMVDTSQINAATRMTGRVAEVLVHEGDKVEAGQLLARLANPEIAAQEDQALASLGSAQALQERTDAGARAQDIASLKATWQSTQAQADLAAVTARRMQNLYAEQVISEQRRDDAVAAQKASAEMAQAALQQYQKALAGTRVEDKKVSASQVAGAQARVRGAQSISAELELRAPASGEVDKVFAHPGEIVLPGVPAITLVNLDRLWVAFNVREDQYGALAEGRELRGSIPALQLQHVAFKVSHIRAQGDFATWRATRQSSGYDVKSFEVRAVPVQAIPGLRPGMSVLFAWPQNG